MGTVYLSTVAPAGGLAVKLASDNVAATVPTSVTVAAGSLGAIFTVKTSNVGAFTKANITAMLGTVKKTAALGITPLAVAGVSVSPQGVTAGNSATGKVTLDGNAPTGGVVVTLTSYSAAATIPATITVAAGDTTATFNLSTSAVTQQTEAKITAALGNTSASTTLIATQKVTYSVSLTAASLTGGAGATGKITLATRASAGGLTFNMSTNNPAVTVDPTVTVPAGETSKTFNVSTGGVSSSTAVTITADIGSQSETAALKIVPPSLVGIGLNPDVVGGGGTTYGVVSLSGVAPAGGIAVSLGSDNTAASVPAIVTVEPGKSTAKFAVTTTAVTAQTSVKISATFAEVTVSTHLTVRPLLLGSVSLSPTELVGGVSSKGTVQLDGPAGEGGEVVTLASSDPSVSVPASVTIPQGKSDITFTATTSPVTTQLAVTITATDGSRTKTATLVVNPPSLVSISMSPDSIPSGKTSTGTVELNGAAPTGGIVVTLSSNSNLAMLPQTVTIPAGQNGVKFTLTAGTVTSKTIVQITATYGTAAKTVNLTITK